MGRFYPGPIPWHRFAGSAGRRDETAPVARPRSGMVASPAPKTPPPAQSRSAKRFEPMSSTHLTRREIKRDEVAAAVGRTVHYAEEHGKALGWAVGGAVVLILLLLGFWWFRGDRQSKASAALSE